MGDKNRPLDERLAEFVERDVPRFTDAQLSALAKTCAWRRYVRRGFMNYRKI